LLGDEPTFVRHRYVPDGTAAISAFVMANESTPFVPADPTAAVTRATRPFVTKDKISLVAVQPAREIENTADSEKESPRCLDAFSSPGNRSIVAIQCPPGLHLQFSPQKHGCGMEPSGLMTLVPLQLHFFAGGTGGTGGAGGRSASVTIEAYAAATAAWHRWSSSATATGSAANDATHTTSERQSVISTPHV
jgi:hypothetical protein